MFLSYQDYDEVRYKKYDTLEVQKGYVMINGNHLLGKEGGFIHHTQIKEKELVSIPKIITDELD